jgi:GntR family transcriptional regulator/MocR family aminotransferase
VLLPEDVDEEALLERAAAAGIAVQGLGALRVATTAGPGLVLGYAHLPQPAIARAVAALGATALASGLTQHPAHLVLGRAEHQRR